MNPDAPLSYVFGDFTLDLARHCLYHHDHQVPLRPKSFDVLEYLLEQNGRVVSKKEVIQKVWSDAFVTDDSLVQCLIDVRRALGSDCSRFIKTVPRRGYIFQGEVHKNLSGQLETREPDWSIAVLSFRQVGTQRDEFMECGFTDALVFKLSALRRLTVRPTSLYHKYTPNLLQAGRQLGVKAVLTGRILKLNKQIRVTVQLLEMPHGTLLWAGQFDEKLTDVFRVQDSICERVAAALELMLNHVA